MVYRANDSEFGLAGGVFTQDLTRAHRVAGQLEAGTTLADWRAVGPARQADGPVIFLEDATAPVGGPRFYRVVTRR